MMAAYVRGMERARDREREGRREGGREGGKERGKAVAESSEMVLLALTSVFGCSSNTANWNPLNFSFFFF